MKTGCACPAHHREHPPQDRRQLAHSRRINASDEVEGGQSVQDAAAVAAYLEQECGVDAIHVTRAVHLHDEFMWAPGITHGGFNADLVTEIKRGVSVPVIAVGRFTEPQYAELLVRQGRADLIAFGRQSIADPELPNKARTGHLEKLSPCIGCLLGCVPNMFAGKPITCAVNLCVGGAEARRPEQARGDCRRWSRRIVRRLGLRGPGPSRNAAGKEC